MDGFLCIDKTPGITSRDVVNQVQRLVRPAKVGHAGTLDPLATGVLVVALGRATRLIQYVQRMPKHYEASFVLGQTSDTEDVSGHVIIREIDEYPTKDDVQRACERFVGTISQRPPKFSALKVNGKRAYELARRGEPVELKKRSVTIHRIVLHQFDFPNLEISVICGGGTYIRSLGHDIGEELGTGAVMSRLRRTAIGSFTLEGSLPAHAIESAEDVAKNLQPLMVAVQQMPKVQLSEQQQAAIRHGQLIDLGPDEVRGELTAVSGGRLLAVLSRTSDSRFRPAINFCA